jgi:hypothetical protein
VVRARGGEEEETPPAGLIPAGMFAGRRAEDWIFRMTKWSFSSSVGCLAAQLGGDLSDNELKC